MRTDYLIQSVSEVKQNSNWASWDFFELVSSAVALFRVVFLCDKDTAESSATPVFPKMFKLGQTDVFGLSGFFL